MGEWIATAHVQLTITAATEEEARSIMRATITGAGLRMQGIGAGPGHAVEGVRLDVPLARRLIEAQKARKA